MRAVYDGEPVLSTLLADRAERSGDEAFVVTDAGTLTYGELADRAGRVATALRDLGVEPGDRVATMLDPTREYLAVWFGIAWAGAVDVPVNTAFKGAFLQHVLHQAEASVLVLDARWVDRLAGSELPHLRHIVVVGDAADASLVSAHHHQFALLESVSPSPPSRRDEHDLVYVMFTSGTTGPSKGVMHSNRSALWNARAWIDILDLRPDDVAYSMFPLFHVTARSAVITSSMWAGARVVMRPGFSASAFWDDVRAAGATWFGYMGAVIHLLWTQDPRPDDADQPARRAFGAAAPPAIIEPFEARFGMRLIEVYGSTELGPATAPLAGVSPRNTQGRPLPQLQLEIHDEHDHRLPPGQVGEIVARPSEPHALFQGYYGMPVETLHAFRNLWFHTGDGGYFTPDGDLVFTDRLKDSLRRRGENISSFEVERAVQQHPGVLECAAYAVPSELTEDEVMIAVVGRPGHELDVDDLLRFCIDALPRFAVPRYVRVIDELPKTPSQRIQKYKLREEAVTANTVDREALGIEVPRD